MLHIVKLQTSLLSVSRYYQDGDVILLIEDAVYCANTKHQYYSFLSDKKAFCLSEDLQARGLNEQVSSDITCVDYRGFVRLTAEFSPLMTWD